MHDVNQTSIRTRATRRWTRLGPVVLGLSAFLGTATGAEAGPQADADRRSREDAAIEAAPDVVARSKVRNDAAAAALRLDLSPRLRTRLWWTRVAPAEAAAGRDAADRADRLASRSFAELLTVSDPAKPRLQAGATAIGATARALRDGLAADGESLPRRFARLAEEAGGSVDEAGGLDGPTLLAIAAATLASDGLGAAEARNRATELHRRAGSMPEGIDALEYELIGRLVEAPAGTGVGPKARIAATSSLLERPRPAGDRLLLAAVQLAARLESGESLTTAIDATRRSMFDATGIDATDRIRLLRGLAGVGDLAAPGVDGRDLPPLSALGRATRLSGEGATNAARIRVLLETAAGSPIRDIRAEALLELAMIAIRGGDTATAKATLLDLIETMPRHPKSRQAGEIAVRLAEATGDDDVLLESTRRVLDALPDHPDRDQWLLERARRAVARDDTEAAREAWEAIPEPSPEFIQAEIALVELDVPAAVRTRDRRTIDRLLSRLDAIAPRVPEDRATLPFVDASIARMKLLAAADRSSEAGRLAATFTDLGELPESRRVMVVEVAAPLLETAGRSDEKNQMLDELDALSPGASAAINARILADFVDPVLEALDRDDRAAAGQLAGRALAATPFDLEGAIASGRRDPKNANGIAWLLAASGRRAEAMRLVDSILESHPGATESLHLRAVMLGGRLESTGRSRSTPEVGDAAAAIKDLRRITNGSSRGSAWWWRATLEELEILVALGRDLDRISTRLQRLEREFPDRGGPDFERRFRALGPAIEEARRRAG